MGTWKLVSATPSIGNRDDLYGHVFEIKFRLKYSPAAFSEKFAEMPQLEWKETITLLDATNSQWWEHVGDQFQRNPGSNTFGSWIYRYRNAYHSVSKTKYGADEPACLYDKNGAQLPPTTFPKLKGGKLEADAVRSYLMKNGGIMTVIVSDTPALHKPTDGVAVKERILTFDCGLHGMFPRISALQHVKVDGSVPEAQWFRECTIAGVSKPYSTPANWTKIPPPADVSIVKAFTGGAHDGTYL